MLLNAESMQPMTPGARSWDGYVSPYVWQLGEGGSECFFPARFSAFHQPGHPPTQNVSEIYSRLNMSLVRSVARAIMGREAVQG